MGSAGYIVTMSGGRITVERSANGDCPSFGDAKKKARAFLRTYGFRYSKENLRNARLAITYDWTVSELDSNGALSVEVW